MKLSNPVQNPVQGKFVYHKALKLSISGLRISGSKIIYLSQSSSSQEKLKGPKRVCYKAQLKHRYPASKDHWGLIVFESSLTPFGSDFDRIRIRVIKKAQGHLGASCSNIGRIRTKENIAVGALLIGAMPNPLGGFLIVSES